MATYIKRGAPATAIADASALTETFTANTITTDAAITITDCDAATTGENLEYIVEVAAKQAILVTKVNAIIAALEGNGTLLS